MLHAVEGVEQGDAAGPALFAAGLVEPLSELRAALQRLVEDEQPALAGHLVVHPRVRLLSSLTSTTRSSGSRLGLRKLLSSLRRTFLEEQGT